MHDRIIDAYLKDFVTQYGFVDLDEPTAFEHFVNYCVISKHHPDSFDPDDVSVGGDGDLGLDGVGILVNDHLALSAADVDYFKKSLRRLDAEFVFIQAKISPRFEAADIGTFLFGVRQFFDREEPQPANQQILQLHATNRFCTSGDQNNTSH